MGTSTHPRQQQASLVDVVSLWCALGPTLGVKGLRADEAVAQLSLISDLGKAVKPMQLEIEEAKEGGAEWVDDNGNDDDNDNNKIGHQLSDKQACDWEQVWEGRILMLLTSHLDGGWYSKGTKVHPFHLIGLLDQVR
jgi:hypothetical protein